MADGDTSWLDKLGGLVKSALGPVIGEKRIPILLEAAGAGLIGGATHGDPYAVDRYWGTIAQIQQRKQLEQLWHNLYPDKPMPLGVQSPQDMLPQYSQPGKYGVWEYQPPGMGPPRQVPGSAPTEPPKVHGPQALLAEEEAVFKAQTGRMPQTPDEYQSVYDIAQTNIAQRKQAGERAGYDYVDRLGGFVKKPGGGAGPEFLPVPGVAPKPPSTGKSDLTTSIAADYMKGMGWHMQNGSSVDPSQFKTRADALAAGAVPLPKDDETKFKQYDVIAQSAREMLALLPSVRDKIGVGDWPTLAGRALSQKLRAAQIKTLAKRDPALAQYLERLQTLSLNMTKKVLPAGRIPVWDQQLLMGVFVSPEMNAPTQESQLRNILDRSEQSKGLAINYAKGSAGAATVPTTPQVQPGEIKVRRKSDGQLGAIPENEFDPNLYERVP